MTNSFVLKLNLEYSNIYISDF